VVNLGYGSLVRIWFIAAVRSRCEHSNRSFWIIFFGDVVQHMMPYFLNVSTHLHADCIEPQMNTPSAHDAIYMLAQKPHCTLKGITKNLKFRTFAKL